MEQNSIEMNERVMPLVFYWYKEKNMEWWQQPGVEPVLTFDEDGQQFKRVYVRQRGGEWEYVIVTLSDGEGEPVELVNLWKGKADYFSYD
jgi:hypothetical protein